MANHAPIACAHTVFTVEERETYGKVWEELVGRQIGTDEREDGFEYRYPGDGETLRLVFEWVGMERRCCPFLTFEVKAGGEDEPIRLRIAGTGEAKAFLRAEFGDRIRDIAGTSAAE